MVSFGPFCRLHQQHKYLFIGLCCRVGAGRRTGWSVWLFYVRKAKTLQSSEQHFFAIFCTIRDNAQCLMTQTSRNLSTFNFASLMPFFRLINPFSCFYRWFLRQNGVNMQKVPWFFKLKLCRGPGPAGVSHRNTETGTHTHTSHHHHWRLCCKINLRILGTHCRHVSNVWLSASADM